MARQIRETKTVKEALLIADAVMQATHPIGEIVGPPGTGKTFCGIAVAQRRGGMRLVSWEGMTRHQLAAEVARAIGLEGPGVVDRLLKSRAEPDQDTRRLIVLDEANKLGWRALELVRYLSDECNLAFLLIGTEMYTRKFTDGRTRDMLLQLGSRIGAKRITTRHMDRAETVAHVMFPKFGKDIDKEVATVFWQYARRGNFREAVELADECLRIMQTNNMQTLTPAVLELAQKWMANRQVAGSDA
jgi:DNA transposition AAA+ family ATPase